MIVEVKPYLEVCEIQPSMRGTLPSIISSFQKLEGKEFVNPKETETHFELGVWLIPKKLCNTKEQ